MIVLFLIHFFLVQESTWVIRGTDIYRPLKSAQVAVGGDDGWFLLDVVDQRLLHYDAAGRFVAVLATRGQGPAGLNKVQHIAYEDGVLYAVSIHQIKTFTPSGQPLTALAREDFDNWMIKVPNAWLAYPHPLSTKPDQAIRLYDLELQNPVTLTSWQTRIVKKPGSLPYRPDIFCFALDARRQTLFLRKPDTHTVEVWLLTSRQKVRTIPLGIRLDPDARFHEVLAEAKRNGTGLKSNSWYPDLAVDPAGNLYMFPIRSEPRALVFDVAGQRTRAEYTNEDLSRILAVDNDHVYFTWREETTGEIEIRRAVLEEAATTMANNPLLE